MRFAVEEGLGDCSRATAVSCGTVPPPGGGCVLAGDTRAAEPQAGFRLARAVAVGGVGVADLLGGEAVTALLAQRSVFSLRFFLPEPLPWLGLDPWLGLHVDWGCCFSERARACCSSSSSVGKIFLEGMVAPLTVVVAAALADSSGSGSLPRCCRIIMNRAVRGDAGTTSLSSLNIIEPTTLTVSPTSAAHGGAAAEESIAVGATSWASSSIDTRLEGLPCGSCGPGRGVVDWGEGVSNSATEMPWFDSQP